MSQGFYELMKKTRVFVKILAISLESELYVCRKTRPGTFNFFLVHKTSDRIKVDLSNRFLLLYELIQKVLRHLKTP